MTWGWSARGELPSSDDAGTAGGGSRGSVGDARTTAAWPRYEAEYLKRVLQDEKLKYNAADLDASQQQVYLDKVTERYKEEADESLKAEFEQWLQGKHVVNAGDNEYENTDGKPVRKWVYRSKEAEDSNGGSKVGQARAGWKHTPWGRAQLTELPGVREYLRGQEQRALGDDLKLQLLAEHGPQNIDDAWAYFKHWVKGRPLSDATLLSQPLAHPGQRSDFGVQPPTRIYAYDAEPSDRQPHVHATDPSAATAAVELPGVPKVPETQEWEDKTVQFHRALRGELEQARRDQQARERDAAALAMEEARLDVETGTQEVRRMQNVSFQPTGNAAH